MKVFFDSDVLLDICLARQPFYQQSAEALSLVESGKVQGCSSALVAANLYYFLRKHAGDQAARLFLKKIFTLLEGTDLLGRDILNALDSGTPDFEDALQIQTARNSLVDAIVTRNSQDFGKGSMPILTPKELLAMAG